MPRLFFRSAVARHSCLYVLAMLALCCWVLFCPSGEAAAEADLYGEPPLWLMLFVGLLMLGTPEALALWLFERGKLLCPAAQLVGAVLLWLCFPLALGLCRWMDSSLPGEVEEVLLPWILFYLMLGSHVLWALGVALAQWLGGRCRA